VQRTYAHSEETSHTLAEIAAKQHGLVRTRQIGLSWGGIERRVRNGQLHRHYRGVYSVGHAHLSREGHWLAAVYAAGDGAALASLSAACLHRTLRYEPRTIHVIAPVSRRPQPGFKLHRCRNLDARDIVIVNGIPVTTVARTLVDLTDVMSAERLANVIHEAAFLGIFSEAATRDAMNRAPGRRLSILEEALRLHNSGSAGSKSRNEDRFLRLVRGAGLPEPRHNVLVHGFEVDFSWPGLCVEVDGPGHARRRTKADDRLRDAALQARGITILRFSEDDLTLRPDQVLTELRARAAAACPRGFGGAMGPARSPWAP
jgi:very-short-patch-repair endonuclease